MVRRIVFDLRCMMLLGSFLLSTIAAQVVAQGPAKPNGPPPTKSKGDDGPGEPNRRRGFDPFRGDGGAPELLMLLVDAKVQQDLKLPADFQSKLDEMRSGFEGRLREQFGNPERRKDSDGRAEFKKFMEEESGRAEKFLATEINRDQFRRLVGILIQLRKYRALSNRLIAKEVGFEGDEAKALHDQVDAIRSEIMEQAADRARELYESGSGPAEFEKFVRENQEKVDQRIQRLLSDDQKRRMEELRASDFEIPASWLMRGGPSDGPRGDRRPPRGGSRDGSGNRENAEGKDGRGETKEPDPRRRND